MSGDRIYPVTVSIHLGNIFICLLCVSGRIGVLWGVPGICFTCLCRNASWQIFNFCRENANCYILSL